MEIGGADRAELEHWLRLQNIPQALATRARIVLGSAAGESVSGLAARLGVTQTTVCLWRRRYRSAGLDGLRTQPRMGRPRRITSAKEQTVISATLRKPKAAGPRRPPAESNRPNAPPLSRRCGNHPDHADHQSPLRRRTRRARPASSQMELTRKTLRGRHRRFLGLARLFPPCRDRHQTGQFLGL